VFTSRSDATTRPRHGCRDAPVGGTALASRRNPDPCPRVGGEPPAVVRGTARAPFRRPTLGPET